jgi:DNA invertase Pin-like site-specific DNA recombinase
MAGLRAAHACGRFGGRRRALADDQVKVTSQLMKNKEVSINEICKTLRVSRTTLYRYVSSEGTIRVKKF